MVEVVEYPISTATLNREAWNRRVNASLMSSFAMEEETIPTLLEIKDLLSRLTEKPLEATLLDR